MLTHQTLDALVAETADNLRFHHAKSSQTKLRTYASFTYQAGSWTRPRKVVARLECSLRSDAGETTSTGMRQEVDIRYIVTSLKGNCEFATLPECLIKIGARVIEHVARIRVQLPTSCPEGALFRAVALGLMHDYG